MWQWQAVIYVPLTQWSYGHFFAVCGFGSSDSLTSSCFFILFFYWLLVSSQKHEHNIVFQAYVQLCMIINNMNPNLYHIYCHIHVFDLIPVKKWNSNLQPPMGAQKNLWKEWLQFFFFFFGEVSFKEWPVIHHKKEKINHSPPPNSAVLLSKSASYFDAIGKILSYLFFVCITSNVWKVSLLDQDVWMAERNGIGEHRSGG